MPTNTYNSPQAAHYQAIWLTLQSFHTWIHSLWLAGLARALELKTFTVIFFPKDTFKFQNFYLLQLFRHQQRQQVSDVLILFRHAI